ncbi:MAG: hypothetical protein VKL42_09875, partial [Snowella sp.]|nr:hypothetical protein [Snowella sp.]
VFDHDDHFYGCDCFCILDISLFFSLNLPFIYCALSSLHLTTPYNDDAWDRVIYSESHDEVSNGKARVPHEISPGDAKSWYARKRSTLAAAMVLTAPGIPMLFQCQEFLEGGWFRDTVPVDWEQREEFHGILRLHHDLIRLRRNLDGFSQGLCGQFTQVYLYNNVISRWLKVFPNPQLFWILSKLMSLMNGFDCLRYLIT